jgi:hypothetical protein
MKRDGLRPPHDPVIRIFWWPRNGSVVAAMAPPRRKAAETRRHADAAALDVIIDTALGDEDAWMVSSVVADILHVRGLA